MKPEPTDIICLAAWFVVPVAFAVWWIRMRLGLDKRWFVVPAAPLISRSFYFALPTFVVGSIVILVGALVASKDLDSVEALYLLCIGLGLLVSGYVFAYLEPDWMSPAWYRWLKKKYGDLLPYLAEEAHQLGRKEWLKRAQTQGDLERWAEEVRRKYQLESG